MKFSIELKKIVMFASIITPFLIQAQTRITRGAIEGEIYVSTDWYQEGIDIHYGIYYSCDNGENIELKYENIYSPPVGEMKIGKVLGDATPGAIYNYANNELWVSFDYGTIWNFREEYLDYTRYWGGEINGVILKGGWGKLYKSEDFALSYEVVADPPNCPVSEVGFFDGELYGIDGTAGDEFYFYYSTDYANTFIEIPIDSSVAYYSIGGYYPQISRGTQPGELYLVSWWPDYHYKIFYSIDTGYTWSQQFESEFINNYYWRVNYTAGRAPGSFYVVRSRIDPETHDHILLYIYSSDDYGQTFKIYFHDLLAPVGIDEKAETEFSIMAFPNPFLQSTIFKFTLPERVLHAWLQILDINSKPIIELNLNNTGKISWDGCDRNGKRVGSGVYFYRVISEDYQSALKKLVLLER